MILKTSGVNDISFIEKCDLISDRLKSLIYNK